MAAYWLPCPTCSQRLRIDGSQAGQTVTCGCGAAVEAPTLRGLAALEPAPEEAVAKTSRWGAKQGIGLVVMSAALAALLGAGYIEWTVFAKKIRTNPAELALQAETIQEMPPAEAWELWQELKRGFYDPNEATIYAQQTTARFWRRILLFGGGAALIAAIGIFLWPAGRPARGAA